VRWIVPEDNPFSFVDEELGKCVIELFGVHEQEPHYQMRVTGYAANATSPLITGICSTIAWANKMPCALPG
jgi:hypothetical protein